MKRKIIFFTLFIYSVCLFVAIYFETFKIVLFLVLLTIIGLCFIFLNERVKQTNGYLNVIPDMENYPTNEWYRKNLNRNFDFVVIGSSSALYAFDYINNYGRNNIFIWADQPQSLSFSYEILKKYYSIIKKEGHVLITLSLFSGLEVEEKWSNKANDKYYYLLDSYVLSKYHEISLRRRYPLFFDFVYSLKRLLRDVPKKQLENKCVCQDFISDANYWVNLWKQQFEIDDLDSLLSEKNRTEKKNRISLLQEIINFCANRSLSPILIIPPIHPSLSNLFSDIFRENYIFDFISKANLLGIPFYNYMDDERIKDDKYFKNSFYLNNLGSKRFVSLIYTDHILNIDKSHE